MSSSQSHSQSQSQKTPVPNKPDSDISLLGQGGFGCVYYRGFDSLGSLLNKRYVTKITKLEKTREIDIGKIISKLPGYDAFFATVISVEPIDLAVLKPGTLDECDMVSRHIRKSESRSETPKFQVLKEAFVPNVSMLELVEQRGGKNQPGLTAAKMLNTLVCSHDHMLLALSRMQAETRVVHYDLKAGNVVFNTRSRNPVIIDFGLSFVIDDVRAALRKHDLVAVQTLRQFFYGYFPDYAPWPLEAHIVCYIVNETAGLNKASGKNDATSASTSASTSTSTSASTKGAIAVLTKEVLSDMLTEYIQSHQFIAEQSTAYKDAFYDRAMRIYTRDAVGRPGMEVIRDYVAEWKRWDYYAIETMFLDLLEVMRKSYTAAELAPFMSQYGAFNTALQRAGNYID
jgi:hypothetical protein